MNMLSSFVKITSIPPIIIQQMVTPFVNLESFDDEDIISFIVIINIKIKPRNIKTFFSFTENSIT